MRSLLFVPGDDEKKLSKAAGSGADALILDLEDSVAPPRKAGARKTVAAWLAERRGLAGPLIFVRVNAFDTGLTDADLDGVMAGAPYGIMLPKAGGGRDITQLGARIAVREADFGLEDGATRILPVATETARAIFQLGTYEGSSSRLCGLTWGAEDLAADLGAESNRLTTGSYADPFRLARSLCLFAAVAAEVAAIDTVFTDFRDGDGLVAEAAQARREGFSGKMAIHPGQVEPINRVFTPAPEAVAHARRIVEGFAENPDAGVIAIDGKMIDRPHLRQAERILDRARAAGVA